MALTTELMALVTRVEELEKTVIDYEDTVGSLSDALLELNVASLDDLVAEILKYRQILEDYELEDTEDLKNYVVSIEQIKNDFFESVSACIDDEADTFKRRIFSVKNF